MTLDEIRRRPTLPGRFQPSTISVLRLNFCVRDGNRWIPQAIVTGNQTGFGSLCCRAFGFRQSAFELPPDLPSFRTRFRLPPDVGSAVEWPPDFLRLGFRFEVPLSIPFLQLRASHPQNRTGRNFCLSLTMTSTSIPLTFSHKLSLVSVSGLGLRSCLTLSHSAFPIP